jgi:hypothetical protein
MRDPEKIHANPPISWEIVFWLLCGTGVARLCGNTAEWSAATQIENSAGCHLSCVTLCTDGAGRYLVFYSHY